MLSTAMERAQCPANAPLRTLRGWCRTLFLLAGGLVLACCTGRAGGAGIGLRGDYYQLQPAAASPTNAFAGLPTFRRLDEQVDFDWSGTSPQPSIHPGWYSARWHGELVPEFTESYIISVESDGGARLWLGGAPLIDAWGTAGSNACVVSLTAGARYPLVMEYFHGVGGARVRLAWSSASLGSGPIPKRSLYPTEGELRPPLAALKRVRGQLRLDWAGTWRVESAVVSGGPYELLEGGRAGGLRADRAGVAQNYFRLGGASAVPGGGWRVPYMGMDTWYQYVNRARASDLTNNADYAAASGLAGLGWRMIMITDGWQGGRVNGHIVPISQLFPNITNLIAHIHARGCLAGIYTEPYPRTSSGYTGSGGFLEVDARDFAAWGIDHVQFDMPGCDNTQVKLGWVKTFKKALVETAPMRPISIYSGGWRTHLADFDPAAIARVVDGWRSAGSACSGTGNLTDLLAYNRIQAWTNLLTHIAEVRFPTGVGPGHWQSPEWLPLSWSDIPDLGGTNFGKAAVGIYSVLSAPLMCASLLGLVPGSHAYEYATNRELLAINQDAVGNPGLLIVSNAQYRVISKVLWDERRAVALINWTTNSTQNITLSWADCGFAPESVAVVRDPFTQQNVATNSGSWTTPVPPMSALTFVLSTNAP